MISELTLEQRRDKYLNELKEFHVWYSRRQTNVGYKVRMFIVVGHADKPDLDLFVNYDICFVVNTELGVLYFLKEDLLRIKNESL